MRNKYTCCQGSPTCANNIMNKRIDHLWWLAILNPKKFKNDLWDYMKSIETDIEYYKIKLSETRKEGGV